jgi:solute carrier family 1 (high affinity glutamate transporter) protein 1
MKSPKNGSQNESHANRNIMTGIIMAIVFGVPVGGFAPELGVHLYVLGEIFLSALKMIVVPLVMCSMVVGITGLGDIRKLGSIGWRTMTFYMVTTGMSVLVGLILVNVIQPGKGLVPGENHPDAAYTISSTDNRTVRLHEGQWSRSGVDQYKEEYVVDLVDQGIHGTIKAITPTSITVHYWEQDAVNDAPLVRPENGPPFYWQDGQLVSAEPTAEESGTGLKITVTVASRLEGKQDRTIGSTLKDVVLGMVPSNIFKSMAEMDVLPLIVFSLLLGAVLSVLGEAGQPAVNLFGSLNAAIMRMVHWLMTIAPFGIFGLISGRIGRAGGFEGFLPELVAVGKYSFTVLLGLGLHGIVTLPLLLWFLGRRNPLKYAAGMAQALLNAFSTASSSATLPITMEGVEEKNGISNRTASFVLPLGATINMDGTALYESVAAMFIAQIYAPILGIEIGIAEQIVIFLTATLAAIGAAGIPEAGLVTMVIVLKAVNLPIEGITLILAVDWLLDRFRTAVNVWGDSVAAGVIETLEDDAAAHAEARQ